MKAAIKGPDLTREYTTRSGDRVVLHGFVPYNSAGDLVSFPIKGTVIIKDHPRRKRNQIWNLQGRNRPLKEHPFDIMDLPPVLTSPASPCADCVGKPITPPKGLKLTSNTSV